ncbi:MAG: AAA family ATPase [Candidatus Diapherotrites archaeon]|uniref:AAA family ATPase n=1 Tax=Candidatus Iainarchaeum sp. TaxID=3101447 RepID=A0A8T4L6J0_9ARCH|nr:AAA family ATPase [Candidatus Diapherotrites archaeon]
MAIPKKEPLEEVKFEDSSVAKPNRTQTGIPGLDDLLGGGIPEGNLVVVSGDPGAGKTSFCIEFLYNGVVKYGENGVYISLEESEPEIVKQAAYYGFDFIPLIKDRRLKIETIQLYDFEKLKNAIEETVDSVKARRIVIDPGVVFRLFFEKELEARKSILDLGRMLKRLGGTTIITNEITLENSHSLFGLEEYVADGVVLLYHTKIENRFIRSVGVLKMRGTKISEKLHPLELGLNGLKVLSKQELFEEL